MWIIEVSRRFSQVDKKSRSRVTGLLSKIGIACGVMTLICVMSVMSGFQQSFIKAILELSSYHLQVQSVPDEELFEFTDYMDSNKAFSSASVFYEAQALVCGKKAKQSAAIIRGVDKNITEFDSGFSREINIISGAFDLTCDDYIVLGSYLAQKLGVRSGDYVNLLALSGGNDVELFSRNRFFKVKGIFECGYYDINQSFAFVSLETAIKYFGENAVPVYGIKLHKISEAPKILKAIRSKFPQVKAETWEEYNRSFFGVLRVEKNILRLVVLLIFVVVAINIFNGMRRLVYDRSQEIAILSALGSPRREIQLIFVVRGFFTGVTGSIAGTIAGIFISLNMKTVFMLLSKLMYYSEYFLTLITNPRYASYVAENPMYEIYASIPPVINPGEVVFIALFGALAPLVASWFASSGILKFNESEVLHYE